MSPHLHHPSRLLAALLLPLLPLTGRAARLAAQTASPEAAARALFTALDSMHWSEAAALVDERAAADFRAQQINSLRIRIRYDSLHPVLRDTSIPEAVRVWMEQQRRRAGADDLLAFEFPGIHSLAELEALSPRELLAHWFQGRDPRTMAQRQLARAGQPLPPGFPPDSLWRERRQVLGAVPRNDSTTIVVYTVRTGMPSGRDSAGTSALATFRRGADGWRLWLSRHDPQFPDELGQSIGFALLTPDSARAAAAKQVVQWPQAGEPLGRAFVTGSPKEGAKDRALVVEDARTHARVRVPAEAFSRIGQTFGVYLWTPDP